MVQGSWLKVQVSRFGVRDSWFEVQGSRFRVRGSVFEVQGSRFSGTELQNQSESQKGKQSNYCIVGLKMKSRCGKQLQNRKCVIETTNLLPLFGVTFVTISFCSVIILNRL